MMVCMCVMYVMMCDVTFGVMCVCFCVLFVCCGMMVCMGRVCVVSAGIQGIPISSRGDHIFRCAFLHSWSLACGGETDAVFPQLGGNPLISFGLTYIPPDVSFLCRVCGGAVPFFFPGAYIGEWMCVCMCGCTCALCIHMCVVCTLHHSRVRL